MKCQRINLHRVAVLAVAFLLTCDGVHAKTVPAQMTAKTVVGIAQKFCQDIGQPVTATGVASFPTRRDDRSDLNEPDLHWLPRWNVNFPGEAELQIVDASGAVNRYSNRRYFDVSHPVGDRKEMSYHDEMKRAEQVLLATNNTAEMADLGPPQLGGGGDRFSVMWDRVYPRNRRIKYITEGATMSLNAYTGELIGFAMNFPTPPLADFRIIKSVDQAIGIAGAHLDAHGKKGRILREGVMEVQVLRHPDDPNYMTAPEDQYYPPNPARPAWTIVWSNSNREDHTIEERVSVDVETGEVLRDESSGIGGFSSPVPMNGVVVSVTRAVQADVFLHSQEGAWSKERSGTLSATSSAAEYYLLRQCTPFTGTLNTQLHSIRVVLTRQGGGKLDYLYLPDAGLIGIPGGWLTVPDALRHWFNSLTLPPPTQAVKN